MKRVLVITYYWPPSGGSGVQRWVKFAKYLPQMGWQPVIYTPENPELITVDSSLEAEVPTVAEVIKRHITEPYEIYRKLTGQSGNRKGQDSEVNPINSGKKSLTQRISLWIRGNLFIPDPRCLWVGPSVKYLKKYLQQHPVDVIVSTGPPHSMHLIARRLALATGIPWVADFRDPWTKMFYFKHLPLTRWARRRHETLEKKVLDDATVVIAVSPLVQEEFQKMTSTPVKLITNGFDESDFAAAMQELMVSEGEYGSENDRDFNIVHTGLFASDGNPDNLWKALSDISAADDEFGKHLKIRLVGKTDAQITDSLHSFGLTRCVENLGYQPHEVAVREQCGASVLILPLRREPEYKATVPGKLFEYLASRRPVIGIGQTDGAMAKILSDSGAGVTFEWEDYAGIKAEILRCWDLFKQDKLEDRDEDIDRYSRRRLTNDLAELFESL